MLEIELSKHAQDMLLERNIPEVWMWRTIENPNTKWHGDDDNLHYAKSIKEHKGRVLHVVVNQNVNPSRIVTVFFDRRLRKSPRRIE
jgi:hypothetical protein